MYLQVITCKNVYIIRKKVGKLQYNLNSFFNVKKGRREGRREGGNLWDSPVSNGFLDIAFPLIQQLVQKLPCKYNVTRYNNNSCYLIIILTNELILVQQLDHCWALVKGHNNVSILDTMKVWERSQYVSSKTDRRIIATEKLFFQVL